MLEQTGGSFHRRKGQKLVLTRVRQGERRELQAGKGAVECARIKERTAYGEEQTEKKVNNPQTNSKSTRLFNSSARGNMVKLISKSLEGE